MKQKEPSTRKTRPKEYLIGQPVSAQCKPVGRATKAYVGFDLEDNRLVFIKDQWRANAPGAHPEIETYQRLRTSNVPCVATCLGGGDVVSSDQHGFQRTVNHRYLSPGIDECERVHARLILKEIGRPLETYRNSGELITVTYHAFLGKCTYFLWVVIRFITRGFLAHAVAWKAGILHRDISIGNILIDAESSDKNTWQGFLTDWDLCKHTEDLDNHVPSLPGRSVSER